MIVSVIDIGTFTTRLAVAEVEDGRVLRLEKRTTITDLGEGLAESGVLNDGAIKRVCDAAGLFAHAAADAGAEVCSVTLTSAARDASNAAVLLGKLEAFGLVPQVIPGEVEGALTFSGVASDAPGEVITVADSGGGSTELATGSFGTAGLVDVRSLQIGCRRVTDLFLNRTDPPAAEAVAEARAWAAGVFAPHIAEIRAKAGGEIPRLFAVGGTVTSILAISKGVVPYDSSRVHGHDLTLEVLDAQAELLLSKPLAERAQTPGLQAKRAPVIGAGALVISELMRAAGKDRLTVSEHDLLYGLALAAEASARDAAAPAGWTPVLSRF